MENCFVFCLVMFYLMIFDNLSILQSVDIIEFVRSDFMIKCGFGVNIQFYLFLIVLSFSLFLILLIFL